MARSEVERVKISRSPGLVHKVYGTDANAMPRGFGSYNRKQRSELPTVGGSSWRLAVPDDGILRFHFRDVCRSARPPNTAEFRRIGSGCFVMPSEVEESRGSTSSFHHRIPRLRSAPLGMTRRLDRYRPVTCPGNSRRSCCKSAATRSARPGSGRPSLSSHSPPSPRESGGPARIPFR